MPIPRPIRSFQMSTESWLHGALTLHPRLHYLPWPWSKQSLDGSIIEFAGKISEPHVLASLRSVGASAGRYRVPSVPIGLLGDGPRIQRNHSTIVIKLIPMLRLKGKFCCLILPGPVFQLLRCVRTGTRNRNLEPAHQTTTTGSWGEDGAQN